MLVVMFENCRFSQNYIDELPWKQGNCDKIRAQRQKNYTCCNFAFGYMTIGSSPEINFFLKYLLFFEKDFRSHE